MASSITNSQNLHGNGVFITVNELFYEGQKAEAFTLKKRARLSNAGVRRSVLRGRGMEFFESRPYVTQDEKRSIDWKVSARRGQGLFTKIFVEEKDRPIFLVVDLRKSMFFGSVNCFKSVLAARLAARLAMAAVNGGDRVGGFIESTQEIYCPMGRSQKNLAQLFFAIAKGSQAYFEKDASTLSSSWPDLFTRIANRAPTSAQILILSDFLNLFDDVRPILTRIRKKADVFAIKIFDPLEEKLPALGSVGMAYNGLAVRFDSSDKALQKNYLAFSIEQDKKLHKLFSSLNIPLMKFSTALSLDLLLRRVFSGQW